MITRLPGNYSTLVANPARRGAKRRNPKKSATTKAAAAAKAVAKQRLSAEEFAEVYAKRQADKIAAVTAKQKKLEAQLEKLKAFEEKEVRGSRRAASIAKSAARKAARKSRAHQKETLGYAVRALPDNAELLSYQSPVYETRVIKRGKNAGQTRQVRVGWSGSTELHKGRKPPYSIISKDGQIMLHKNPRRRKNPGLSGKLFKRRNGGLVIAGVPMIEFAIGAATTIATGALARALIDKYAVKSDGTSMVPEAIQDISGEIVTALFAAFAHSKLKNPMQRDIAKYAFLGAMYQIATQKASEPIEDAIAKILPDGAKVTGTKGAAGAYFGADTGANAGLYLNASGAHGVGGAYMGVTDGLGLYQGQSIYG